MKTLRVTARAYCCAVLPLVLLVTSELTWADSNGLLVQAMNGKLVTGVVSDDLGQTEIPVRAFWSQFPSTFAWNNPGFHSLGTPPAGISPLPAGADLEWDFLPMTTDGLTSNMLYWDGQGSTPQDVEFGAVPHPDYSLTLFGRNNASAAADGSANFIVGETIDTMIDTNGLRMHAHRFFFLDDNDGSMSTPPDQGVYLISMQVRMSGFETSDPFFMVWGTLDIPSTAITSAALPWVEQNIENLAAARGDFNADGQWGQADIDALVAAVVAGSSDPTYDMNGDGTVSTADVTDNEKGWLTVGGNQNPQTTGGEPFLVGDANLDGLVDGLDFIDWNSAKFTQTSRWSAGDFNVDGLVDGLDFILWNDNKFSSSDTGTVPEPITLNLLIVGLLPLVRCRYGARR